MFKIETTEVIGGQFEMGSSLSEISEYISLFSYAFNSFLREEIESWFLKQVPKRLVSISSFSLGVYPITNLQYSEFEKCAFNKIRIANLGKPKCPVERVSFYNALAFCQWMGEIDGNTYRLPTEAEWEYAASSRGLFRFPWGNIFSLEKANTAESGIGETIEVGSFQEGASQQGIYDLAGNVEEWTSSMYLPYSGGTYVTDHISRESGVTYPVLRGGSYRHHGDLCLATRRHGFRENYSISGFRVIRER